MTTALLKVIGMSCDCSTRKVVRVLKTIRGVEGVSVSLAAGEVIVEFDERLAPAGSFEAAVRGAGYRVTDDSFPSRTPQSSEDGCDDKQITDVRRGCGVEGAL